METAARRVLEILQSHGGRAAALSCALAALVCGARLDGYSHALHPLALPGAGGVPGALAFNIAFFIVPGLLAAMVAIGLYGALPRSAGWLPRIGVRMLLLSALAFAARGLFPLDLGDLDGPGSGLHASAWLAWWIAFVAGAPLLAAGLRQARAVALAAAVVMLAAVLVPSTLIAPPYAERIGLVAWLLWLTLATFPAVGARHAREAA